MSQNHYFANTFSIVARDPETEELGVAVQSKFFAVGGIVPWAQAGVGAVATQAYVKMAYGARGLALLKRGHDPEDVIGHLIEVDPLGAHRQLGIMDARGRTSNYTGNDCPSFAGGIAELNVTVQGNLLAGERVLTAMLRAFKSASGKLGERMIAALEAGQKAGGDKRGQQSAGLLVVREKSDLDGIGDMYVNLRVDDHATPIAELRRLYGIWEKQMYPFLEGDRIKRLLKEKKYARAQKLHRNFSANVAQLARRNWDDAGFMNALGWQLGQNALGLDAALKYAKRAAKLAPKNENIADTLAFVLYQRGEVAKAIEIESKLVAKYPDREDFKAQLETFEKEA